MTATAMFVGIDIARTDFVVACRPDSTARTAPNDAPGITATVDRLPALALTLIVLEATGDTKPRSSPRWPAAGLPVVVANPRQVRDFAKATGKRATTDIVITSFATDVARSNVSAYGVFHRTHSGPGGPVPPTGVRPAPTMPTSCSSRGTRSST